MKKIIAILICAFLLMAFTINATASAMQVTCDSSVEAVKKGGQVVFTFSVSGAELAKSALIEISYGSGFEIISGEWLKSGALMTDFNGEDGVIAFENETNFNGNLFKLVLKAGANADAVQKVNATVTLKNGANDAGNASVTKSISIEEASSGSASSAVSGNKATEKSGYSNTKNKSSASKTESSVESKEDNSETDSEIVSSEKESSLDNDSSLQSDNSKTSGNSSKEKSNTKALWIAIISGAVVIIAVVAVVAFKKKKA